MYFKSNTAGKYKKLIYIYSVIKTMYAWFYNSMRFYNLVGKCTGRHFFRYGRLEELMNCCIHRIMNMAVARIEPGAGFQQHGIEAFWDASNIFLLSYSKTPRSRARPQVHPRGHHFYEFVVL